MVRFLRFCFLTVGAAVMAASAHADAITPYEGPIFDAHVHYSQRSWGEVSVGDAFDHFDRANVRGIYASSTPDEGTLKLLRDAPAWLQVVPSFRPYRPEVAGSTTWWKVDDTLAYTKERLATGHHHSIGEVHIQTPELLDLETVRGVVAIAAENGWPLHVHSGADVVEKVFSLHPDIRVVWAHVGFFEEPARVQSMMDTYKNLWADLSYREGSITSPDGVNADWKRVFLAHPDRFMIGSDTWVTERWHGYQGILNENRVWLGALPRDVAEMIAWKNAERVFGLKAAGN